MYECPLPNMRIGGVAIVSAMSVALVSNKKAQERILVVDRSLKPAPQPNPAAAPAQPAQPAASAPAHPPLAAIPEEDPQPESAPPAPRLTHARASDIAEFVSWLADNEAPTIPGMDKTAVLAAASRNLGGPVAVCAALLREGFPVRWSAADILSRWGQWVRGEIPYGPGAGSQANTDALENPFGKPHKRHPHGYAMADTRAPRRTTNPRGTPQ